MVSPVRIRVPPLKKVLQIAEKQGVLAVSPGPFVNGVSTAGSRNDLFKRGRGVVLHAFCGVGADGKSHPDIGVMTWIGETRAA